VTSGFASSTKPDISSLLISPGPTFTPSVVRAPNPVMSEKPSPLFTQPRDGEIEESGETRSTADRAERHVVLLGDGVGMMIWLPSPWW
jgi:hypothetical protein